LFAVRLQSRPVIILKLPEKPLPARLKALFCLVSISIFQNIYIHNNQIVAAAKVAFLSLTGHC
jgi:hypothetical protein